MISLAPLLLTMCIIPLTMINLHKPAGELLSDVNTATVAQSTLSRWEYLCTQFSVIVTYLRLLILPVNQNLDYAYPVNHSLLEPRAVLSFLLLVALLVTAFILWRSSQSRVPSPESRPLRLASFGIFWFFITLSVESSVIPIFDIIYEHRVYLPSVGFFIAVVSLAALGADRLKPRMPAAGSVAGMLLIVAILLLGGATYARNRVWRTWETLWQDVKMKSPMKARSYNNLGTYYGRQGRTAEAINEFEAAIRLYPEYLDAHYNLGKAYIKGGRYRDAAHEFRTAQLLDPQNSEYQEFLKQLEIILKTGNR
jgi:tetratricopeptide (TPR) repeat protein